MKLQNNIGGYFDCTIRVIDRPGLVLVERVDPPVIGGSARTWELFLGWLAVAAFSKRPLVMVSSIPRERSSVLDLPGAKTETYREQQREIDAPPRRRRGAEVRLTVWTSDSCPPAAAVDVITSEDFYEGLCWLVSADRSAASTELYADLLDAYPEAPKLSYAYFDGDPDGEELRWGLGSAIRQSEARELVARSADLAGCRILAS